MAKRPPTRGYKDHSESPDIYFVYTTFLYRRVMSHQCVCFSFRCLCLSIGCWDSYSDMPKWVCWWEDATLLRAAWRSYCLESWYVLIWSGKYLNNTLEIIKYCNNMIGWYQNKTFLHACTTCSACGVRTSTTLHHSWTFGMDPVQLRIVRCGATAAGVKNRWNTSCGAGWRNTVHDFHVRFEDMGCTVYQWWFNLYPCCILLSGFQWLGQWGVLTAAWGYLTLSSYITAHPERWPVKTWDAPGYLYQNFSGGTSIISICLYTSVCLTCNEIESFQMW